MALIVVACSGGDAKPSQSDSAGSCPTSQPAAAAAGTTRDVTMVTSKGTIVLRLSADLSPIAVGNFLALVDCGYYNGVIFHRVVPGFVIQGGDPDGTGRGGPGYTFEDEPVTLGYARGTVAMANAGPNTNGSQFFICLQDLPQLPPKYTVFGQVLAGLNVVDAIAAGATGPGDRPVEPVTMKSVSIRD